MDSRSILASDIPMTQSMFWKPVYLPVSAWLEHLPFAFWLTDAHRPQVLVELGAHYGASYFAFCQAISQLGLDARSYAVDTWKGDEHAGFYGEEVFGAVRQENEARYTAFSRLVRSTFEDAVEYFEDGSIDLLHIDGHHTYESVRMNFEQWQSKLSSRGLVLLHDTNVRERNFGVFRFVDDLRQSYPVFDFSHGHGLSCVAVGPDQNDAVRALLAADKSDDARRDVRAIFSRLGRACSLAHENTVLHGRESAASGRAQSLKKQVEDIASNLAKVKGDLASRTRERDEAQHENRKMTEATAFERGVLTQKLEDMHVGQKQAMSSLEETCRQIAHFNQEYVVSRHMREQEEASGRQSLMQRIEALDASLKERGHQVEALQGDVLYLTRALEEKEQELASAHGKTGVNRAALEAELMGRQEQLTVLNAEKNSLMERLAAAEKTMENLRNQVVTDQQSSRQKLDQANAKVRQIQASLDTRYKEIATLTKMLQEAHARDEGPAKSDAIEQAVSASPVSEKVSDVVEPLFSKRALKALRHTISGRKVRRLPEMEEVLTSGLFDKSWYCAQYGVSHAGDRALEHFMLHAAQGHSPGPDFDSNAYLDCNPDVRIAGFNPVLHYVRHGKSENRRLK